MISDVWSANLTSLESANVAVDGPPIDGVPFRPLVVFFLRSRRCSYRRRLQVPRAGINVPGLILVGRFSGDPHWPVLGDRWGFPRENL